ncbi:hypothetical protein ACQR1I_16610 [Bradyrhizobium sp. HKCCYLS2038]|uniref:hypothetical protein n=1 Tax=unclassified Bradyrhizobium TaxID=2631580 RepID=UPI003EC05F65
MSVADLKARLADVAGIENLSMELQGGRILLRWGTYSASVDAAASNSDIEAAVRDAIKLPPLSMIPDKPAAAVVAPAAPVTAPAGHTGTVAQSVAQIMESHVRLMAEAQAANVARLQVSLQRQRDALQSVGNFADKIDGQTDDFLAVMGQFTNEL